jgi:hypothetical protein
MNSRFFRVTIFASSAFTFLILCVLSFPLGVPGEWTWVRISYQQTADRIELSLALLILLLVGLGWLYFVRWGATRFSRLSPAARGTMLLGLWASSLLLVGVLQSMQRSPYPQLKAWVLYYPHSSGYFHTARYEMQNVSDFLAGYEDRMAEGDVFHIGTHPPGLFLLHRFLWSRCENSPALTETVLATMPASISDAFDELDANLARSAGKLTAPDRASLWLAMLLTQSVAVATIVPLYLLVARYLSKESAWLAAACWPLVPSLSIFLPKSDALYPFIGMLFLWLWVSSEDPKQWWRACAAGLVFWIGALLSLAVVPIGLIAGLYSVFQWFGGAADDMTPESSKETQTRILLTIGLSAGTFLLATLVLWLSRDINLFSVWAWNYQNHARFYDEFTRTLWKWWLVNPLETFFAVGAPLATAAAWGLSRLKQTPLPFRRIVYSSLLVWGLIWLSGKNSGEAGRLWLVFLPIVCLPAGVSFEDRKDESCDNRSWAVWVVALQLAVCAVTVATVWGFWM